MPNYRRLYVPGGTVFLTVVTHERRPLFKDPRNIARLRQAATTVMAEIRLRSKPRWSCTIISTFSGPCRRAIRTTRSAWDV